MEKGKVPPFKLAIQVSGFHWDKNGYFCPPPCFVELVLEVSEGEAVRFGFCWGWGGAECEYTIGFISRPYISDFGTV